MSPIKHEQSFPLASYPLAFIVHLMHLSISSVVYLLLLYFNHINLLYQLFIHLMPYMAIPSQEDFILVPSAFQSIFLTFILIYSQIFYYTQLIIHLYYSYLLLPVLKKIKVSHPYTSVGTCIPSSYFLAPRTLNLLPFTKPLMHLQLHFCMITLNLSFSTAVFNKPSDLHTLNS